MSTSRQAIRSRKKAKFDPRYAKQARRDVMKRTVRLARLIESEKLRKVRKGQKR